MGDDNTGRFTNRGEDYAKYRPAYPKAMVNFLEDNYGLKPGMALADVGAGTGISTELFLKAGYTVYGVEPNDEMRAKAEELLHKYTGFRAQKGTGEHTGLADDSVDGVTVCQAFHWLDVHAARPEFKRIVKPGGMVAIMWNERQTKGAFAADYDALIVKHAIKYVPPAERPGTVEIGLFFANGHGQKRFDNKQVLGLQELKGRLRSSSYMPGRNDKGYAAMIKDTEALHAKHERNGVVTIAYETVVYAGRV